MSLAPLAGLLLLLAACEAPLSEQSPPGPARLSFEFQTPVGMELPTGIQVPITSVAVAYTTEAGGPAVRSTLGVSVGEAGYRTEPLELPPGKYTITELFALDGLDQAYGVLPAKGSYYGDLAGSQTVPFSIQLSAGTQNQGVSFRSIHVFTEPADYGFEAFPTPRSVAAMDFSYRVVDESGSMIPSFLLSSGLRTTSSGGSSSMGWGYNSLGTPTVRDLFGGLKLSGPAGYQGTGQLVYVTLRVGAYGYEESPELYFFPSQLDERRQVDPVIDVVLRAEASSVHLIAAGTNDAGQHIVKARLAASQFIERGQAEAGAAANDKYSYTIGFTLGAHKPRVINGVTGWVTAPLVKTPSPSPISSTFYTAPYDSSLAQTQNAYKTLEAELVLKDEAAWADFNDASIPKIVQVYVEMLMLKGDGRTVIRGDEDFLGFRSKVLKVGPQQVTLEN